MKRYIVHGHSHQHLTDTVLITRLPRFRALMLRLAGFKTTQLGEHE